MVTPMTVATTSAPIAPERVLSTLKADGSRRWLTPKLSKGRFLAGRRVVAYLLILVFTAIPYIQVGGKPLMLLDLPARRFIIFGLTFLPTDTLLLALFMVAVFISVFLVTALFGRIWCGWACPQTVYMEFLYRPIERLFDGAPGRRKNHFQASGLGKPLKYATYLIVSCFLAHTFLAYFVGVARLAEWVQRSPFEHPLSFVVMLSVTGLMMFDFAFFREQTCTIACPYGRLQSVMLDRHSLIVGYDRARGEPRGAKKAEKAHQPEPISLQILDIPRLDRCASTIKTHHLHTDDSECTGRCESCTNHVEPPPPGDCVDCNLCVTTCPTGIDIRDGLQMECIGCAQCIDACDRVMTKLGRPRGLIRYSSQAAMADETKRFLRARVVIYPVLLLVVVAIFTLVLITQSPVNVTMLRGVGRPFNELSGGLIANPVRLKLTNRTDAPAAYRIEILEPAGATLQAEALDIGLGPGESLTTSMNIVTMREVFSQGHAKARLRITTPTGEAVDRFYALVGPTNSPATQGTRP
jgi:polyferredoxin